VQALAGASQRLLDRKTARRRCGRAANEGEVMRGRLSVVCAQHAQPQPSLSRPLAQLWHSVRCVPRRFQPGRYCEAPRRGQAVARGARGAAYVCGKPAPQRTRSMLPQPLARLRRAAACVRTQRRPCGQRRAGRKPVPERYCRSNERNTQATSSADTETQGTRSVLSALAASLPLAGGGLDCVS